MDDIRENLVEFYLQKYRDGMGFSEIRKELTMKNYDDTLIKDIIRVIDNKAQEGDIANATRKKINEMRLMGYILMLGGGVITIGTYFGLIHIGGYYLIMYGPIIGGYLLILRSRRIGSRAGINAEKKSSGLFRH